MTIISKPSADKKTLQDPLVDNIVTEHPEEQGKKIDDGEGGHQYVPYRTTRYVTIVRARPYYFVALLLMLVLLVTTCILAIFGTEYMYRRYHYMFQEDEAVQTAPYGKEEEPEIAMFKKVDEESAESKLIARLLSELSYLNAANEAQLPEKAEEKEETKDEFGPDVEKEEIDQTALPAVKPKDSRYVHDFYNNLTAIVDTENGRCYVMKLDRSKTPLPDGLNDLIEKLGNYYVDTQAVRQEMRVVLPAVKNVTVFGSYIGAECGDYTTYELKKQEEIEPIDAEIAESSAEFAAGNGQLVKISGPIQAIE